MKNILESRINIIILLIMCIFMVFTIKLVEYQIIDGEEYFEKSNSSTRINQTITAARGDILDINGSPIASSTSVFNVVLNKAYLPNGETNERILQAVQILTKQNETINDILPISTTEPYTYDENKEAEINRLKNMLTVNVYATEEDVMSKLIERYSLQDIPKEYQRTLVGIRYTMEREGFSADYPFSIAKDVSVETVSIIFENAMDLPGVEINETSKRYYANGTLLPHLLGTVGPIYAEEYEQLKSQGYKLNDTLGKSGLEKSYENYLKGVDGIQQIEKNKSGEIVDKDTILQPEPGDNIKLTIDADLQKATNEILANQVETLRKKETGWGKETSGASVVVIDVKTGGILAVSNYPNYDLNEYSTKYDEYSSDAETPLFNRAFQGLYRPGSVFKIAVSAAALLDGIIDEKFTYNCKGVYDYFTLEQWGGSKLPGCAGYRAHGVINVEQAIKVSCNCFFYDLGRRLGIDKINEVAKNLGLGVKTGIELNERTGVLSSPEQRESSGQQWQVGDTIQASIGQLDTAITTVQLATFAATVANNGVRYNTHLVSSIESFDGKEVKYETPITVISNTDNTNNAFDIIEKGMILASQEGNAKLFLSDLPYTIASKTGTAQVPGGFYNATIMAYGPVESPEIAIAVIAEKAGNGYNLAQTVRDIFNEYYRLKAVRAGVITEEIVGDETLSEEIVQEDTSENIVVDNTQTTNSNE